MSILRKRLKELRDMKGYTMEDLGKLVGASKGTISNYENGHSSPSNEMIVSLAKVLGTTTDYLLGLSDDPSPTTNYKTINSAFYDINGITEEEKQYLELQLEIFRKMKSKNEK